jgi:hypothetical protein
MLLRIIFRWTGRALAVLILLFVAVYIADFSLYKLRGAPTGHVAVNRYVSIPLKGQRTEFDYLGTADTPCAEALFPQNGQSPCWQLRRNPNQGMTL